MGEYLDSCLSQGISAIWIENSFVQVLNWGHRVHSLYIYIYIYISGWQKYIFAAVASYLSYICIYIHCCNLLYIYIYIYFFEKNKNWWHEDYRFISILLWVLIWINNTKNNRSSSDLMDKIIQNRHRKEGWEGLKERWRVPSPFRPLPVF